VALEYKLRTATGLLADLEMTDLCGLEIGAEMSDHKNSFDESWMQGPVTRNRLAVSRIDSFAIFVGSLVGTVAETAGVQRYTHGTAPSFAYERRSSPGFANVLL